MQSKPSTLDTDSLAKLDALFTQNTIRTQVRTQDGTIAADPGQIKFQILQDLKPTLEQLASGQTITPEEYALLAAIPNVMTASGYEYMLGELQRGIQHNLANHIAAYVQKELPILSAAATPEEQAKQTQTLGDILRKIDTGEIALLQPPSILSNIDISLVAAANPPVIASATPYLNSVGSGGETARSSEGFTNVLKRQGLAPESAKSFSEAIASKYPLLPSLLAGEEKAYLRPMLTCGAIKGPDGQAIRHDYMALLKLERETKKFFFETHKDDLNLGPEAFVKKHGHELYEYQDQFLKAIEKQAKVPEKDFSMLVVGRAKTLTGIEAFRENEKTSRLETLEALYKEAAAEHKPSALKEIKKYLEKILGNLRENKILEQDMVAFTKCPELLKAVGYGYLHGFAQEYMEQKGDVESYMLGNMSIQAKISRFLEQKGLGNGFVEGMGKGEYTSMFTEMPSNRAAINSIILAAAISPFKEEKIKSGEVPGDKKLLGSRFEKAIDTVTKHAISQNPSVKITEIKTFIKEHPLLAGIAAAPAIATSELQNIVAIGSVKSSTTGKSAYEEFAALEEMRLKIVETAFSPSPDREQKLSTLNTKAALVFKEAHTHGLLSQTPTESIEFTDNQKTLVGKSVGTSFTRHQATLAAEAVVGAAPPRSPTPPLSPTDSRAASPTREEQVQALIGTIATPAAPHKRVDPSKLAKFAALNRRGDRGGDRSTSIQS